MHRPSSPTARRRGRPRVTPSPVPTPRVSPANLTAAPTNDSARAGMTWEEIVRELRGAVHRIKQDAWLQWGLLTGLSGTLTLAASITAYVCVKRRCCRSRCCKHTAYRLQDSHVSSTTPSHGSGGSSGRSALNQPVADTQDGTYEEIDLSATSGDNHGAAGRSHDSSSEDTVYTFCPPSRKVKHK